MPLLTVVGAITALVVLAVFVGVLGVVFPGTTSTPSCGAQPDEAATADIPAAYLALYVQAGKQYEIPWQILAAIGKAETDHGRNYSPRTRHHGATGPMQFLPTTWKTFGVDGDHDGHKNIDDPADAIPAAAAYLHHNGAPYHLHRALLGYNHADEYVTKILSLARNYAQGVDNGSCVAVAGSARAETAVRSALAWIGTPYSWGGGGLNGPTTGIGRGAGTVGFDCSGLTRYAWHQAGVTLPRIAADQWRLLPHVPPGQEQPGDLVFFRGAFGSGTAPGHVGLVIGGGRMIEAPGTGERVRVSVIGDRSDLIGYARPGGG